MLRQYGLSTLASFPGTPLCVWIVCTGESLGTRLFQPRGEEERDAIVMDCICCVFRTVPAFCCFLDGSGEVVDFLRLNHLLNRRVCPFPREREEKVGAGERRIVVGVRWWKVLLSAFCVLIQEEDLRLFKRFINRKRPDLVVVAAESR